MLVAWKDDRDPSHGDIFSQRIERSGNWGYPSPTIVSVRDVPGDQGGFLNLAWDASRLDAWPHEEIYQYGIWRAIDEMDALSLINSGEARFVETLQYATPSRLPAIRVEQIGSVTYYWEQIDLVYGNHVETYSKVIPTLFDSSGVTDEYHYFQVTAYTSNYENYWTSEVDSGHSVDNIAPCLPLAFSGEQSFLPEGLSLKWHPNTESDLSGYAIYRGTSEGFVPGPASLIAEPCDTFYFDGGWHWSDDFWYKLAAVDVHGNESDYAVLGPSSVTGEEAPDLPMATCLSQNHPNPFNPVTMIRFDLAETDIVSLRIYDAAGRLVNVLATGRREAGSYELTWDGRDSSGRQVTSGVYFYKLSAGEYEKTRKMILLR
jgi:hypothetical protein